ncbi:MAG TPA: hypothetical protein VF530_02805 [Planctomycetota bacterium]
MSPIDAQAGGTGVTNPASPIAAGNGTFMGQNPPGVRAVTFSVQALPQGRVGGFAIFRDPGTNGFVHMNVTSMMFLGSSVAVAGPITMQAGSPFPVGATAFFVVQDNGDGTLVPDQLALGVAPLFLGSLTIQEVIGLIGPPPPQAFTPLLTGNIRIF